MQAKQHAAISAGSRYKHMRNRRGRSGYGANNEWEHCEWPATQRVDHAKECGRLQAHAAHKTGVRFLIWHGPD
jgi:hypothetical protein